VPISAEEAAAARRHRTRAGRMQYLAARLALRNVLPLYVGRPLSESPYWVDPLGKPRLSACEGGADIEFSVTHSGLIAAIAVTRGASVGIDIEQEARDGTLLDVLDAVFNDAELSASRGVRVPPIESLRFAWTIKEAVCKAAGIGLPDDPKSIDTSSALVRLGRDGATSCEVPAFGRSWWVASLALDARYVGAVAAPKTQGPYQVTQFVVPTDLQRS
jgi:4'-phosphopantetheinyl transferase